MSTILKSYKFRIYPNTDQQSKLNQAFGAARWIFNHFLHENKTRFQNGEKHLSGFDCNKLITGLKKETETSWLKEIDDWVLKNSSSNLDQAFKNFFSSVTGKRKGPTVSYPKFKKRGHSDSFRTTCKLDQVNSTIKIPKIPAIKCVFDREILGKVKSVTISKVSSGKFFASILVEEEQKLLPMTGVEVGIDLGLKDLIILDNGTKFKHPDEIPGYAFDTGTGFPVGSTISLVNNYYITGRGGNGGNTGPQNGSSGGPGLIARVPITITNNGVIQGGGGGGGAGQSPYGGGGGGPGAGGSQSNKGSVGYGGAGGASVAGNSAITWVAAGTRYGAIS